VIIRVICARRRSIAQTVCVIEISQIIVGFKRVRGQNQPNFRVKESQDEEIIVFAYFFTELKRHISIHMKHMARAAANQSYDPKLVSGLMTRNRTVRFFVVRLVRLTTHTSDKLRTPPDATIKGVFRMLPNVTKIAKVVTHV
jgi:hypothetical protein